MGDVPMNRFDGESVEIIRELTNLLNVIMRIRFILSVWSLVVFVIFAVFAGWFLIFYVDNIIDKMFKTIDSYQIQNLTKTFLNMKGKIVWEYNSNDTVNN